METIGEIIPFAKEILNQKPSRGMLKIYMIGTTLAMLGLVGGLMETVCQQFAEDGTTEDEPVEVIMDEEKKKNQKFNCQMTLVRPDVADVHTPVVDATHLMVTGQRSSANRSHAS